MDVLVGRAASDVMGEAVNVCNQQGMSLPDAVAHVQNSRGVRPLADNALLHAGFSYVLGYYVIEHLEAVRGDVDPFCAHMFVQTMMRALPVRVDGACSRAQMISLHAAISAALVFDGRPLLTAHQIERVGQGDVVLQPLDSELTLEDDALRFTRAGAVRVWSRDSVGVKDAVHHSSEFEESRLSAWHVHSRCFMVRLGSKVVIAGPESAGAITELLEMGNPDIDIAEQLHRVSDGEQNIGESLRRDDDASGQHETEYRWVMRARHGYYGKYKSLATTACRDTAEDASRELVALLRGVESELPFSIPDGDTLAFSTPLTYTCPCGFVATTHE